MKDMIISDELQKHLNNPSTRISMLSSDNIEEIISITAFLADDAALKQRIWHLRHNIYSILLCANTTCNDHIKWKNDKHGYGGNKYCSRSCCMSDDNYILNKQKTNLLRYGVENAFQNENVKEKQRKTLQERYGVDNVSKIPEVRQKAMDTMNTLYGVPHIMQNEQFKEQYKQDILLKYGVENLFQLPSIQEKIKKTLQERHGVDNPTYINKDISIFNKLQNREFLYTEHVVNKKTLLQIGHDLGCSDATVGNYLRKHYITTINNQPSQSIDELDIVKYLHNYNIDFITNTRNIILPYELDIYIPSHNLAMEYCGLYWHSEVHVNNNYHKQKYDLCKEKGIRLLTIFEDEWTENQNMIENKILHILGIGEKQKLHARKCNVEQVPTQEKSVFFNQTHIQGDGPSSINIGLYYNDELVACLGFIKEKNNTYNLSRYSTFKNVVGGFTKLLSYFEKTYNPKQIYTFADLRWSEGDLYYKSGFVLDKELAPDYAYMVGKRRIHKFNMRHKYLENRLKEYDPTLSEHQNCLNAGIYRIYDCGKLKFVKNYK